MAHASCKASSCVCDTDYYNFHDLCREKINVTDQCEGIAGECVEFATCTSGRCHCAQGYYERFGQCHSLLLAESHCEGVSGKKNSHFLNYFCFRHLPLISLITFLCTKVGSMHLNNAQLSE